MRNPKPEVVEVTATGKPGTGKTRLLDRIADSLETEGYVRILREERSPTEIADTHQYEAEANTQQQESTAETNTQKQESTAETNTQYKHESTND